MLLPELKQLAGSLGIKGTPAMRKSALVEAISAAQVRRPLPQAERRATQAAGRPSPATPTPRDRGQRSDARVRPSQRPRESRQLTASRESGDARRTVSRDQEPRPATRRTAARDRNRDRDGGAATAARDRDRDGATAARTATQRTTATATAARQDGNREQLPRRRPQRRQPQQPSSQPQPRPVPRPRPRRRRDRNERRAAVNEDDVLIPVAGILDLLDNYAFVRTTGYLPGPNDVYVALSMVRKFGLRKGDAITGAVRQRDRERRAPREVQPAGPHRHASTAPSPRRRRTGSSSPSSPRCTPPTGCGSRPSRPC